jgi:hypothetical protein
MSPGIGEQTSILIAPICNNPSHLFKKLIQEHLKFKSPEEAKRLVAAYYGVSVVEIAPG